MSRGEEITAILTEIAGHLQSQQQHSTTNLTSLPNISSLNQTLNLNNEEDSRVRVLETTLSLMCFKTPQVFNLMVEDLVQTIVTVLKSSIMCKVLSFQKEEFLQIGSSISRFDCEELIKACLDIFERLQGHHATLNRGLTSVLQLQIGVVLAVLDVLALPMRWGLSMEIGSKLPFSQAYFPNKQPLLLMLAGPVSCKKFLELVHFIKESILQGDDHSVLVSKRSSINGRMIDHTSTWALLIDFPVWFYFSASLLFTGRNCTVGAVKTHPHDSEKILAAASRYLTWILSPTNEYHSGMLLDFFMERSKSFEKLGLDTHKVNASFRRKLGKPKVRENKDTTASKEYDGHSLRLWLNEFHDCLETYLKRAFNNIELIGDKPQKVLNPRHSLLFRRIPLGIFIGVSDINEEASQYLLHYAASGSILPHGNKMSVIFSQKSDEKEEAIEGIRLVFDLFDVIEEMAELAFDAEGEGIKFICQLKVKAARFLVTHVGKLLSVQADDGKGGMLMFTDLQRRLSMWKHPSREGFQGFKDLDDICNLLNFKLASYENS